MKENRMIPKMVDDMTEEEKEEYFRYLEIKEKESAE